MRIIVHRIIYMIYFLISKIYIFKKINIFNSYEEWNQNIFT